MKNLFAGLFCVLWVVGILVVVYWDMSDRHDEIMKNFREEEVRLKQQWESAHPRLMEKAKKYNCPTYRPDRLVECVLENGG